MRALVRVTHQRILLHWAQGVDGLLPCIQHEAGGSTAADFPPDDPASERVDNERRIDENRSAMDVGGIHPLRLPFNDAAHRRDLLGRLRPQRVRPLKLEGPIDLSSGHGASRSGTVATPDMPRRASAGHTAFISRSTVHLAMVAPSRRSCRHTVRDPYKPEFSSYTRRLRFSLSPCRARAERLPGSARHATC